MYLNMDLDRRLNPPSPNLFWERDPFTQGEAPRGWVVGRRVYLRSPTNLGDHDEGRDWQDVYLYPEPKG